MELIEIKYFIESALLAAGRPLSIDQLQGLFDGRSTPEKAELREAVKGLNEEYEPRGIEIAEVASGFRMQVKANMSERLHKLWEERPPRYSRALFETLALIAYRQPMTRGEIEEVRGVAVSSNIIRSLLEREWIRVVGHRDVPGRPALFGTTKLFLDYFGLKKLDDLPPLADLSDWESLRVQLNLPEVEQDAVAIESADPTESATQSEDEAELVEGESSEEPAANDDAEVLANEIAVESTTDGTVHASAASGDEAVNDDMPVENIADLAHDDAMVADAETSPEPEPNEPIVTADEAGDDELPVLDPVIEEATGVELPVEPAKESAETPRNDNDLEELVVREWPDPASGEPALDAVDEDVDAKASGG